MTSYPSAKRRLLPSSRKNYGQSYTSPPLRPVHGPNLLPTLRELDLHLAHPFRPMQTSHEYPGAGFPLLRLGHAQHRAPEMSDGGCVECFSLALARSIARQVSAADAIFLARNVNGNPECGQGGEARERWPSTRPSNRKPHGRSVQSFVQLHSTLEALTPSTRSAFGTATANGRVQALQGGTSEEVSSLFWHAVA